MAFVTLRNISGEPLLLGLRDGRRVAEDAVVRVEGVLAKEQPEDAIIIGEGDDARAYPTTLWSKVSTGKAGDPDVGLREPGFVEQPAPEVEPVLDSTPEEN